MVGLGDGDPSGEQRLCGLRLAAADRKPPLQPRVLRGGTYTLSRNARQSRHGADLPGRTRSICTTTRTPDRRHIGTVNMTWDLPKLDLGNVADTGAPGQLADRRSRSVRQRRARRGDIYNDRQRRHHGRRRSRPDRHELRSRRHRSHLREMVRYRLFLAAGQGRASETRRGK